MRLVDRIKNSWNVFRAEEKKPTEPSVNFTGFSGTSFRRPDRTYFRSYSGKDIRQAIYNRIAVDFANVQMRHVRLDKDQLYLEDVSSHLNECLSLEANIDQGAFAFRQDICQTLLEEGTAAIVPVDTSDDPNETESHDIYTMRVGAITEWNRSRVRVRLYREETGKFEDIWVPKAYTAIVENPFYSIMNESNSTLSRLARKIALMDAVDEQIGSGKLDLIIQLPYIVKTDTKRVQAEKRRSELEDQLSSSQYGVAYTDGTERITQLNRPIENNLIKNVEYLTKMAFDQLGITPEILNGTASEEVMLNYMQRTIKPLLEVVTEGMKRRFLSKTARTQGHSIEFFIDPFTLVPVSKIGEFADKFIRNEVLTSNELRGKIGFRPSKEEKANKLYNPNMPIQDEPPMETSSDDESPPPTN